MLVLLCFAIAAPQAKAKLSTGYYTLTDLGLIEDNKRETSTEVLKIFSESAYLVVDAQSMKITWFAMRSESAHVTKNDKGEWFAAQQHSLSNVPVTNPLYIEGDSITLTYPNLFMPGVTSFETWTKTDENNEMFLAVKEQQVKNEKSYLEGLKKLSSVVAFYEDQSLGGRYESTDFFAIQHDDRVKSSKLREHSSLQESNVLYQGQEIFSKNAIAHYEYVQDNSTQLFGSQPKSLVSSIYVVPEEKYSFSIKDYLAKNVLKEEILLTDENGCVFVDYSSGNFVTFYQQYNKKKKAYVIGIYKGESLHERDENIYAAVRFFRLFQNMRTDGSIAAALKGPVAKTLELPKDMFESVVNFSEYNKKSAERAEEILKQELKFCNILYSDYGETRTMYLDDEEKGYLTLEFSLDADAATRAANNVAKSSGIGSVKRVFQKGHLNLFADTKGKNFIPVVDFADKHMHYLFYNNKRPVEYGNALAILRAFKAMKVRNLQSYPPDFVQNFLIDSTANKSSNTSYEGHIYYMVRTSSNKMGVVREDAKVILKPKYDEISGSNYNNGFTIIQNGYKGAAWFDGTTIPAEYKQLEYLGSGFYIVWNNREMAGLRKLNSSVNIPCKYYTIDPFPNEVAFIAIAYSGDTETYDLFDADGKKVFNESFTKYVLTEKNEVFLSNSNRMVLAKEEDGRLVLK